jgi:broad specificity phosphatase PhoE
VHVVDSLNVKDSVNIVDSVRVVDSVSVVEPHVTAFVPLRNVLDSLAAGEKIVAVLRHAERGSDYSSTGPLNDEGVQQALSFGEKLKGDFDIYFAASPATRTHQTCSNIAKGMGLSDTLADTLDFLGGSWFVKDTVLYNQYKDDHGGSWKVTSRWLYDGRYADAFYELSPRVAEYLDDNIVPAFERSGKRVGIFISHDLLVIPVVALVSDNSIDMNYYTSKKWLNYLAGFAIVLKPDGKRRIYAVKGLDAGTMKKE